MEPALWVMALGCGCISHSFLDYVYPGVPEARPGRNKRHGSIAAAGYDVDFRLAAACCELLSEKLGAGADLFGGVRRSPWA